MISESTGAVLYSISKDKSITATEVTGGKNRVLYEKFFKIAPIYINLD